MSSSKEQASPTSPNSLSKNAINIYLDDTLQTLTFQKQALQIKLKHNIAQLSNKNTYLSTILKELCLKQYENMKEDCEVIKQIIRVCKNMEDDLNGLDILEKKTEILKAQVMAIAYRFNQVEELKNKQKQKEAKQIIQVKQESAKQQTK